VWDTTITAYACERVSDLVTIGCRVRTVNRDVANRTDPVEKGLGIENKTCMPMVIARKRFSCEKFTDEAFWVLVNVHKAVFSAGLGVLGNVTSYEHSCRVLVMTKILQIEVAYCFTSACVTTTGHP
jgi:hypothetical protein